MDAIGQIGEKQSMIPPMPTQATEVSGAMGMPMPQMPQAPQVPQMPQDQVDIPQVGAVQNEEDNSAIAPLLQGLTQAMGQQ